MKKYVLTILGLVLIVNINAQVLFSSSFESWASLIPIGWENNYSNNIDVDSVTQVTGNSIYGNNAARLQNTSINHKRFSTQAIPTVSGNVYTVTYWAKGSGDIRVGLYHGGSGSIAYQYPSSTTYNAVTGAYTMYTQQITADSTSSTSEFILSVKSTVGPNHILVDSFFVNGTATAIETINDLAELKLAPNPSNGNIIIRNVATKDILTIYDVTGKIIYNQTILQNGNLNLNLIEKNIQRGIYFIQVARKEKSRTIKFILED
jgi:hypothetical protein